jgi:hypothetical protein
VLTSLSSIAMGTKRFWWELDGSKRNLDGNCSGTWWEQKDVDGLLMRTRGICWELFVNLMANINPRPLQKDKEHSAFFLLENFRQKAKFSYKNLKLKWLWRFFNCQNWGKKKD